MTVAPPLAGREVLLVVGGGISAYQSAQLARELLRLGARVETVLTAAAQRFVGGVTFAGITGRAARTALWDPGFAGELHIELTRRADLVVVAPATADLLARAALGLADDLATTVLLSARGPVVMAPAMHPRMWEHAATRSNVRALAARGVTLVGPVVGALASGEEGIGRMSEPEAIAAAAAAALRGATSDEPARAAPTASAPPAPTAPPPQAATARVGAAGHPAAPSGSA
jgi:phosphopantothenoylcysteine decarboxylase / phosphopantothenate---cysteine ligase